MGKKSRKKSETKANPAAPRVSDSPVNAFDVPTWRRRLISLVYESFLLGAVLVVFFLLPQTLLGVFAGVAIPSGLLWVHFFGLLMVYFTWFWLRGGQTLAMKTWRIRVVDVHGGPLRPLQAVLRYCAAWFGMGLAGFGVLVWPLVDKERLFLHDRIADTRLVLLPKQVEEKTVEG